MKVTVYNCRSFDEKELFEEYGKELGIELVLTLLHQRCRQNF